MLIDRFDTELENPDRLDWSYELSRQLNIVKPSPVDKFLRDYLSKLTTLQWPEIKRIAEAEECEWCNGDGMIGVYAKEDCPNCQGKGYILEVKENGS